MRKTRQAGERRNITMLFCDVADSTRTAENLDPEIWTEVMAGAIDLMVQPVERYGGTVARLMGDAILAYFGAPVAHEDDPQRALLAAVEIRDGCRAFAVEVQQRHGLEIDIRIGINSGLVVVGDMGSDLHNEYAALGDAANVAARMEQTAARGTIRITEATHRRVAPFFDVEAVGAIDVKGRREPVEAWVVHGVRATPGQLRGIDGVSAPMVGRAAELATLTAAVEPLVAGSGRIISIVAEAGLGKSRLVAEFAASLDGAEVQWLAGQSHSYQDTTPFTPFRAALQDAFGVLDTGSPREQAQKVGDQVAALELADPASGAFLRWLLRLPNEAEHASLIAGMDPPTLRGRVFEAVGATIEALADHRPMVLVLDDLHWADSASLDLLVSLLPLAERVPLLLVLMMRPRHDEPSWAVHETARREWPHRSTTIELRPLDTETTRGLVAELLKVEGLSTPVRQLILDKAEGNPLFVEEVVRSLLDDGVIVRTADGFVTSRDVTDLEIPDSLAALLVTRLDALSAQARHAVQLAAVVGREFSAETLRDLLGADEEFDGVVSELLRREFFDDVRARPERILGFHHALIRDAAYGTLLKSTRRELHGLVAAHLEETAGHLVQEISRHFLEAGDTVRAVPFLVKAGDEALGAYAGPVAVTNFTSAISMWQQEHGLDLLRAAFEGLGNAYMFTGNMDQAQATFTQMKERAEAVGDDIMLASALNKLGLVEMLGLGNYDVARQHMDTAKVVAKRSGDADGLAEFYVGYCILNTSIGNLDEAERGMGEAAEVCFTLDPFHRNYGLTHYAHTLVLQTRFGDAKVAVARAIQQAEADRDLLHLAMLKDSLAWLAMVAGDSAGALALAQQSVREGEAIGAVYVVLYSGWSIGEIARLMGRHDVARAAFESIALQGMALGHFGMVASGHVGLARCRQLTHGTGDDVFREHLGKVQESIDLPLGIGLANHVHGEEAAALLVEGDLEGVEQALLRGRAVTSALVKMAEPELLLCAGGLAMQRGQVDKAVGLLRRGADYIDEHGLGHMAARARLAEAAIAGAQGDIRTLRDKLKEADDLAIGGDLLETLLTVRRGGLALFRAVGDEAGVEAQQQAIATW